MSELRRDPLRGHWSIIASERSRRPSDFHSPADMELAPQDCPFCPGHERDTPPEVLAHRSNDSAPDTPGWSIRVFQNRYPAVKPDAAQRAGGVGTPLLEREAGVGVHEIVVATPDHARHWAELSVDHWDRVWVTCQHRMHDAWRLTGTKHVTLFINHGTAAGASRAHPHLQIVSLPVVPHARDIMTSRIRGHYAASESCLACDVLEQELTSGARIVAEDLAFVTYAPFASRAPFECLVMPRAHRASFLSVAAGERRRFALHLREVLLRLQGLVPNAPFNLVLHSSSPNDVDNRAPFHWYVEIVPRLAQHAGLELGSGTFLNPLSPEDAAEQLRRLDVHG